MPAHYRGRQSSGRRHYCQIPDTASLITVAVSADGEPRVGMLETIREYALERLEAEDDPDGARRRHAEYYAAVVARAARQLDGPEHLVSLDKLGAEQ